MNNSKDFRHLDHLNPEQQKAVTHKDGPLLILAGAGSGKTSTMTHRIAYLIKHEGVSPYNILAVTFTNKAAGEMRERVNSLIGEQRHMWILTFHSACLRILRMYADRIGYERNFVVYDPGDQKTVIKNCIKEANADERELTPAYILSIISDCKEKGISPEEFERTSTGSPREKKVAQIYMAYEKTLKTNNAMDFDDLILRTVQLFTRDEEALAHFRDRFQYIMVDEYQDTNHMQYRVVKMLAEAHNNICVVGDDDQCIYQWRGADINNILDFEKDFRGTKVIKLEQNYRSHGNILAAAHSIIKNNQGRKPKKLWTDKEKGEKIKYYRADDDKDEARYIAQEIDRLAGRDRGYRDFAILYRTNAQSRRFEEAFISRGIPYRVLGGFRYYDRKEVKDMIAYMRLVQNPGDDLSMERIINEPKRGIGEKTVMKLKTLGTLRNESLFQVLADPDILAGLPGKAAASLEELAQTIRNYADKKEEFSVSDIYDGLLVQTGYYRALEQQNTVEAESRIENLLEFKSVIYDYEKEKRDADEKGSLAEFLESIALMAEVDNHEPEENAVVLMTIHSAKGLEFPVVFMPGMEDGLFPGYRSLEKADGIEEERRLCYVGMTRAKERLYLISATCRMMYGRMEFNRESAFLRELDKSLVEGDAIFEGRRFDPYSSREESSYEREVYRPFASMASRRQTGSGGGGDEDAFAPAGGRGGASAALAEMAAASAVRQTPEGAAAWQTPAGAAAASAARQTLAGSDLAPGDKVSHKKFGVGQVISVEGNTAAVIFDSVGTKRLALDVAPLSKVQ